MRITRTLRVSLASTCILLTAFAAGEARAAMQAQRTVQDANKQLMLSVPFTWLVQSPSGNVTLKATAPASGRALPDSVDVVVHALPSGVRDAQSCEREAEWVTQHLVHVNFTTWSTGPAVIGGLPAYTHTYVWKASTSEPRWSLQACIVQNSQGFVLTGTTGNAPGLPARAAVLRRTINSLRITARPQAQQPAPQPVKSK